MMSSAHPLAMAMVIASPPLSSLQQVSVAEQNLFASRKRCGISDFQLGLTESDTDRFWWENTTVNITPNVPDFDHKITEDHVWMNEHANLVHASHPLHSANFESETQIYTSETLLLHKHYDWDILSLEESFTVLKQTPEPPSIESFLCILQKCRKAKGLANARSLHAHICNKGLEAHRDVGNYIVPMFVECGSVSDAEQLFCRLVHQNEHSWTSLIIGSVQCGHLQNALDLYQKMRNHNVHLSGHTLVAVLKACARLTDVERGREVHVEIARMGLETDPNVGSTLIGMYARCGSLPLAQEVFDKLLVRNVVSWTALIAGYAEYGPFQKALEWFEQMQIASVSPNPFTFACVLKACGSVVAIDKGREIHTDVTVKALEADLFVGNSLVGMYAKCGSLSEAREAFYKLPVRDVVTWTALIAGYAEHGPAEEALSCFEKMQLEGVSPNAVTFACALKACGSLGATDKGREIHRKITGKELTRNTSIGNSLVGMYAKCGLISEARVVLDELPVRDVVSWTALISGYAEHGLGQDALDCFEKMQADNLSPNAVTFSCILKACSNTGSIDKGRDIHSEIAQRGFEAELSIGNTLVGLYAKCGLLVEAQEVFDKLPVQDVVSWNALIAGYAEHGPGQEAMNCFEQMQLESHSPDAVTIACCLKACGSIGAIEKGRQIHMDIAQEAFTRDPSIGNSLISMYAKCGSLSEAREVFDKLPVRDVVAWSSIIKGYGINHEGSLAMQCFEDMHAQGVKADAVTFICLLNACSHASLLVEGREYFKVMREGYGILPTIEHFTCMVDLLARSGRLYEAEEFLQMLCPLSLGIWAALLSACKTHGEAELGLRCFQHLVHMKPDDATWYVLMADIYAGAGRWDDAHRVEELRKSAGAKKKPACASIEVNKQVHEFVVGHNRNEELLAIQRILGSHVKDEGHVPNLDLILKPLSDSDKETALCQHAEKLAIAFGLVNTPQGETLRLTKNLRMCNDCHDASKAVSRIERREIILRDDCCIHHFKDGLCSCGDMF